MSARPRTARRRTNNGNSSKDRSNEQTSIFRTIQPQADFRKAIMPDKITLPLKYCSSKSYTTGVGGIVGSIQEYALNDLYDPDITGAGHQPYGFDQVTPFFNLYTVLRVKVAITVSGVDDASTFLAWMVKPALSSSSLVSNSLEAVSEQEHKHWQILSPASSAVTSQQIVLPTIDLAKEEGLSRQAYLGNNNYRALVTGSPGYKPTLTIGVGNAAGLSSKTAVLTVELIYEAYFESRNDLPQS